MRFRVLKTQSSCKGCIEKYGVIVGETSLYYIIEASEQDAELLRRQGYTVIAEKSHKIAIHFFSQSNSSITIDEVKVRLIYPLITNGLNDANIRIAILDSGVNLDQIPGNLRDRLEVYDYTGEGSYDELDHGTWVTRIALELTQNAKVIHRKIISKSGEISAANLLNAFEEVYYNDHIVNCSWGFAGDVCERYYEYEGLMSFTLQREPILFFFAAAGNDGAAYNAIDFPAASKFAFAVAATNANDSVTDFSSRGPVICGGGTIYKPDIATYGVIDIDGTVKQGTSFASPIAASLCAYLVNKYYRSGLSILNGHRVNPKLGCEGWCEDYGFGILKPFVNKPCTSLLMQAAAIGLGLAIGIIMPVAIAKSISAAIKNIR